MQSINSDLELGRLNRIIVENPRTLASYESVSYRIITDGFQWENTSRNRSVTWRMHIIIR